MVQDPYSVLGIPESATQEEIKKAYRRKAKEYHPDLHPNDPVAAQKMNEVNEAYDMLMNPEKYAQRRARQEARSSGGGYGQQQGPWSYEGPDGWSSDFDGFDFGDIFGSFYGGGGQAAPHAQADPRDGAEFRRAAEAVNQRQYQAALRILGAVPGAGRNARWHYLSALANYGLGNTILAVEQIQKASRMEPDDPEYRRTCQRFQQAGQTYQQNGRGFHAEAADLNRLCLGLCAAQLLCRFCAM